MANRDDDYYDDEDTPPRNYSGGRRMDAGHAIEKNIGITDDNKLQVFNFSFDIGDPQLAAFMRSGVTWATNQISLHGAAQAKKYGTIAAEFVLPKKYSHIAPKVGVAAYNSWLFGLTAMDFGLGLKKTVQDGYASMYELREQAQPLLAANNHSDASIGRVLTSKFGVLAHARAKRYHDVKAEILGSLVDGIRIVPNIIMGIQKKQMDHKFGMDSSSTAVMPETRQGDVPDVLQAHEALHDMANSEFWRRLRHPQSLEDYQSNISKLTKSAPVVDFIAGVAGRRVSHKQLPEDAWDKIVALEHYVKNDNQPDIDRVVDKVKGIFEQRAVDLDRSYKLEGSSYESVVKIIADAIVQDGLHPQALVEILDNTKIVTFDKHDVDFGEADDVKHQVDKLVMKYNRVHVEKEVYQNAPFTRKTLAATYKDIPAEEKPFFTLLFPPGILENAGVPHEEVKNNRLAGKQEFLNQLTDRMRLLMRKGPDELRSDGVKTKYIADLEDNESAFRNADRDGEAEEYVRDNLKGVTKLIRNIAASAKKPGQLWKEHVGSKEATRDEITPKTPLEHAERDAGDEVTIS